MQDLQADAAKLAPNVIPAAPAIHLHGIAGMGTSEATAPPNRGLSLLLECRDCMDLITDSLFFITIHVRKGQCVNLLVNLWFGFMCFVHSSAQSPHYVSVKFKYKTSFYTLIYTQWPPLSGSASFVHFTLHTDLTNVFTHIALHRAYLAIFDKVHGISALVDYFSGGLNN
jgi:hypothetical protein